MIGPLLAMAIPAAAWTPPAFSAVRAAHHSSESVLLDRRGRVLHELRVDPDGRRLDWIALGRVSPLAVSAVILAEDRRFFSHPGVDPLSAAASALSAAAGREPRGASTLTMQVAAFLDPGLRPGRLRRSPGQKLRQAAAAIRLERRWSKREILEAYLNLAGFRGELRGISAASQGLFGKEPHGLDAAESAVLAALLRAPQAAADALARRAIRLNANLGNPADEKAVRSACLRAAAPHRLRPAAALAPHAARRMLGPGLPRTAASTLDAGLQSFAAQALRQRLLALGGRNVRDGALLVVDNRTGEALAYVGHAGGAPEASPLCADAVEAAKGGCGPAAAWRVDGIRARRQAGSTLKPFLYALALDRRLITPASLLDDSPIEIDVGRGLFAPENYDHSFRGPVSARTALAASINVPAVRLLGLVGEEAFRDSLSELGFGELREGRHYGPSLALGTPDVTLWELVGAYRAVANQGLWGGLRLTPRPNGRARRVLSPQAAYLLADILSDREARSSTFGLESVLATRFWTAVKTGTSKDMRDNWCVGFSARYTAGVWVGNHSGAPMWSVSGVEGAAPAWADVMAYLHRGVASRAPRPPEGLVRRAGEWFLAGTEPAGERQEAAAPRPRILSPADGAVLAIDPDIPAEAQALAPEAEPRDPGLSWRIDGEPAGSAETPALWRLRPGDHDMTLTDAQGQILDAARFQVR